MMSFSILVSSIDFFYFSALGRSYHGVKHGHAVQHLLDRNGVGAFLRWRGRTRSFRRAACRTSGPMVLSGGAVTGPVGATVEVGTKRNRDRFGRDTSARPLLPNSVKLSVVAVATEQNRSAVAPFSKRSMTLEVSSEGPGCNGRWCRAHRAPYPRNRSYGRSSARTAVRAPPGASSGCAPYGGDELSCASGVLCHHGHDLAELAFSQTLAHLGD